MLRWLPLAFLPLSISLAAENQTCNAHRGVVCSSKGLASEVGVQILKKGGNAVDSACAVGLALAVVHPAAGNLGGGGFMLIRMHDGRSIAVDYRETAPKAATETMYQDANGKVTQDSLVGYRASGVPGTVAGLYLAHRKYGRLPWRTIVQPAIDLASRGFKVSESFARDLQADRLSRFDESKRVFQRGGSYYHPGEVFPQPDLAATLTRIRDHGAKGFYRGKTAELIADAMRNRGLITKEDLSRYRPSLRKPITGTYRGYQVITMPPPSSGGIALMEMLNILEPYRLDRLPFGSTQEAHLKIEAMRRAFADRTQFLGDPDFVQVPTVGLTSHRYAQRRAKSILPHQASKSSLVGHGDPAPYESNETTHFSVVDRDGNAVSNTYTLNFGFGSGVTIPGAGFLMNDEMDDFTGKVGVPNAFNLIQGSANAIRPGKRPLSSMTPTIILRHGRLFLVLGSPGGPTIITTVFQVLTDIVDHHLSPVDAVRAARFHHQWLPDTVSLEPEALSTAVRAKLEEEGYRFVDGQPWGDAEVIEVSGRRRLLGASDPRNGDSEAVGY